MSEELDLRIVLKLHGSTRLDTGPFKGLNLVKLGEGSGWTYAVLSDREGRVALARLLEDYAAISQDELDDWNHPKSWAKLLDDLDGISLYGPEDRRDPGLNELDFDRPQVLDVLLWPADRDRMVKSRVNSITKLVRAASSINQALRIVAIDPRPQSTLVRVTADRRLLVDLLEDPWVERVRPPLRAAITLANVVGVDLTDQMPPARGEPIGVIDGVPVTNNPLLVDTVRSIEVFPAGHTFSGPDRHGTAVAAAAAWGDLDFLVTGDKPPSPHPVVCARVLDPEGAELAVVGQAHRTIGQAIRWLREAHGVKVVNISINRSHPVDTLLVSELTTTLDQLARELDVVLVVSTGNRSATPSTGWLNGYPGYLCDEDAGIAEPGDAALALTVGALARRNVPGGTNSDGLIAIAPERAASPFTRTGPSRGHSASGTLKPEFVHHGGNWAHDYVTGTPRTHDPGISVITAIPPTTDRFIGAQTGTSFAAPAVAREVARIASRYPKASANLLRALTALSARQVAAQQLDGVDPLRVSAYGQPDADRVLESSGSTAILTIETTMTTNSVVVHPLPVPYEFAQGVTRRTFRVALAYDPPVRRSRREYTAGQMTVEMVRGLELEEVERRYQRQVSVAEANSNPGVQRLNLPSGKFRPSLQPGTTRVQSNTLIRRDFIYGSWDPDDEYYFLVVTHNQSPWTSAQRAAYAEQRYALAVQVADEERTELDLHNLVREQLRSTARIGVRGRVG